MLDVTDEDKYEKERKKTSAQRDSHPQLYETLPTRRVLYRCATAAAPPQQPYIFDLFQVIFIADSHRPLDVCNIYNDGQIRLLVGPDDDEGSREFFLFWLATSLKQVPRRCLAVQHEVKQAL